MQVDSLIISFCLQSFKSGAYKKKSKQHCLRPAWRRCRTTPPAP